MGERCVETMSVAEIQRCPVSPIRRLALLEDAKRMPAPQSDFAQSGSYLSSVEIFSQGVVAPTFAVNQQPLPEVDMYAGDAAPSASPSCAEYIEGDSTSTDQLLKFFRTCDYQATEVGEPDAGVVAPNCDKAAVANYLAANANINARDAESDGFTCLHHAASTGRIDHVSLLVSFGANIDVRDYDGNKAEDVAREAAKHQVDNGCRKQLLECMHILVQAKQVKDRTRRFMDAGFIEFPTSPNTPSHPGCSSFH